MTAKTSRRERRQQRNQEEQNNLKLIQIDPMTVNQQRTFDLYNQEKNLLLYGTAGTGKTFVSLYLALEEVLTGYSTYNKVVIIRSVVPTRDMGFLPGNAKDKAMVYESPYYAICTELLGRGDAYELLKRKGTIEFMTSSFVRGITLKDCIVVVDEMQNMEFIELHSIITRVGENCKVIFCGDYKQTDLKRNESGFNKFAGILKTMKSFDTVEFNRDDIVRSDIVKEYIIKSELYETKELYSQPLRPAYA
jgi:phosphate starvation-inducible protein PhoH and related proteins